MSKAKFQAAKELIDEKKYGEARALLKSIDHPTAREWEAKLDKLSPPQSIGSNPTQPAVKRRKSSRTGCLLLIAIVLVLFYATTLNSPPPSQPIPTVDPVTQTAQSVAMAATTAAQRASDNQTATVIALTPATATATITETPTSTGRPLPSATFTSTPTPSVEERAKIVLEEVIGKGKVERLSVLEVGTPNLLAMDYPMPETLVYHPDAAGREMLKMACGLYAAGFTENWRFQFSAMINIVNTANGQTTRDDGLSIRVSSITVSGWNCANVDSMNPEFAAEDYILNPLFNK